MNKEIERKFLIIDRLWRPTARGVVCRQGYLHVTPPISVRVRVMDTSGSINIKRLLGDIEREEFEYPIPFQDAVILLDSYCVGSIVEKTRYTIPFGGMMWEVDVFSGLNTGLIIAEIELESVDQTFEHPPWLGQEVSGDPRYLNAYLSQYPYSQWELKPV